MDSIFAVLAGEGATPWLIIAFCLSALVVWFAGARLAQDADRFARKAGLSGAVVGLVILGGITSLPEVATSSAAALGGAADLAIGNLLGGVAFQLVVLAIADAMIGRKALTSTVPRPDVLAYAVMTMMLLALAAAVIAIGDYELWGTGFGVGAAMVLAGYVICILVARSLDRRQAWRPVQGDRPHKAEPTKEGAGLLRLSSLLAASAVVILVAGFVLTRTGETLAERSGLGQTFFGTVFLAIATSLPELSSARAALKLDRPQMAIGDIFGGNLFDLALIAMVDALDQGGPVLATSGPESTVAAMMGILLCGVFVVGMIERRDRTVLRMGWDSATVVTVYLLGISAIYLVR